MTGCRALPTCCGEHWYSSAMCVSSPAAPLEPRRSATYRRPARPSAAPLGPRRRGPASTRSRSRASFVLAADERGQAGGPPGLKPSSQHRASRRPPAKPASDRQSRATPLRRDPSGRNPHPSRRRVVSAMTIVPGSASCCRRAAKLGTRRPTASSRAAPSPTRSPTTATPVAMPTLAASRWPTGVFNFATALIMLRPARTARSAASSWALGQPK